jgi:hypothetical protein
MNYTNEGSQVRFLPSIRFEDWKGKILAATDLPELMQITRDYLAAWRAEDLRKLPWDLAATALMNADDIVARATLASRAELMSDGQGEAYRYLREMALTLAAAATKLRRLRAEREQGFLHKSP